MKENRVQLLWTCGRDKISQKHDLLGILFSASQSTDWLLEEHTDKIKLTLQGRGLERVILKSG